MRYRGRRAPALDGVSCGVGAVASCVAVVGPNGSGKTTLVRAARRAGAAGARRGAACRIVRSASWSRSGAGPDPRRSCRSGRRSRSRSRVEEAVMLGRYAHLGPLAAPRAADRAAVARRARALRRRRPGRRARSTRSRGGEWQRVRVARALAQEPDVAGARRAHRVARRAARDGALRADPHAGDGGLAGLVITHQLNLAARFADRIVLLDRGPGRRRGPAARRCCGGRRSTGCSNGRWRSPAGRDGSPQVVPLRRGEGDAGAPPSTPFPL